MCADVSDPSACENVIETAVSSFGGVDVLVHAGAVLTEVPFLELDRASWQRTIDVNLTGTFQICQAAARAMIASDASSRGGGRIVNISSTVATMSEPSTAHYAASKGGVAALTRSIALELAAHGISANCIAPGYIRTAMNKDFLDGLDESGLRTLNPSSAFGQPENIAQVVSMLCDRETRFLTGATIAVDGGQTAAVYSPA